MSQPLTLTQQHLEVMECLVLGRIVAPFKGEKQLQLLPGEPFLSVMEGVSYKDSDSSELTLAESAKEVSETSHLQMEPLVTGFTYIVLKIYQNLRRFH